MTERDLYSYRDARRKLINCEEALFSIKTALTSPKAQVISFMPFSESSGESTLPDKMDKYIRLEESRDRQFEKMKNSVLLLGFVFDKLDKPTEREYLLDRYFFGLSANAICRKRRRGRSSIYRDRDVILKTIAKLTFVV
jgi:hypothetical protein